MMLATLRDEGAALRNNEALEALLRVQSVHAQEADYSADFAADGQNVRGKGYLHTMRDLTPKHAPLLRVLIGEGRAFVERAGGGRAAGAAFFHYPYEDAYSSMHVHIRSPGFAPSERMPFALSDVAAKLDARDAAWDAPDIAFISDSKRQDTRHLLELAGSRAHKCAADGSTHLI